MAQDDGFTEIGGGDFWGSKDEPIQPGDAITGEYVASQSNVGPNNSMVYTLRTEDGDKSVWGSTVLDTRMERVRVGDTVRITFVGLSQKAGKFGKPFKVWKVEVKPGTGQPAAAPAAAQQEEVIDAKLNEQGEIDLNDLPY
jgi:hypothetical protein